MGELPRFAAVTPNSSTGAPAGYYLLGLVVEPTHRRQGAGAALTAYRLAWLAERTRHAWYFADTRNGASRALHARAGFTEVTSDFWFPGASGTDGSHVLCRMDLYPRETCGEERCHSP